MAPVTHHPFDPLDADDISRTLDLLHTTFPGVKLRIKLLDVNEPIKSDMVPYLEAERLGLKLPQKPPRIIHVLFHRLDNGQFLKAYVNVDVGEVLSVKEVPKDVQGNVDVEEVVELEEICLRHPTVIAEIKKLQLPHGYTVCVDPWVYGCDDENETRRLTQCYLYLLETDHPQTNHYSLPLPISPVFDCTTKELIRMDYLPTGTGVETSDTKPWKQVKAVQYAHDLLDTPVRSDLKPLIVQQPDGASFKVSEKNVVNWQKWRFRVGFNCREGLVLYNVTYDGRNLFYRLALSEMAVPYGDPRKPYNRKQAFDVGDVGLGITANQLTLGCDCLGQIKYFSGYRCNAEGKAVQLPNVICMHEQDGGLLHKHTNYRTGATTVVRNRQLVVQMVCTLANYEYIFAWYFDQAAGIEFEVRATGILSTMPLDNENGVSVPWGTNVGPGVMAAFHQHMFSLRIDPAIDGYKNTVTYEDSVAMPVDPVINPLGVGYIAKESVIKKAGTAEVSIEKNRVFKIRNDNVINNISYKPVAYKVQTAPTQMLLMSPTSFNAKRAAFASHPVWVTKYRDGELYAAGEFTNQSRKDSGLSIWAKRDDDVEKEDVVFWHTFGLTHNPRPEDFPIMPVEKLSIHLKPSGFFEKNPALDVPRSSQSFNNAVLEGENGHMPTSEIAQDCCDVRAPSIPVA